MQIDCGHTIPELPAGHVGGTGYGIDSEGRKHCYPCCHDHDLARMRTEDTITGYLSSDGATIANWPGGVLARVTAEWETSAGGFARRTKITRVRAIDASGCEWYGRGPGRGMYIRLRKARRNHAR
jgi:hypothetical protein